MSAWEKKNFRWACSTSKRFMSVCVHHIAQFYAYLHKSIKLTRNTDIVSTSYLTDLWRWMTKYFTIHIFWVICYRLQNKEQFRFSCTATQLHFNVAPAITETFIPLWGEILNHLWQASSLCPVLSVAVSPPFPLLDHLLNRRLPRFYCSAENRR